METELIKNYYLLAADLKMWIDAKSERLSYDETVKLYDNLESAFEKIRKIVSTLKKC